MNGTIRTVRGRDGSVTGYRALLPRELSTPPKGCKHPERYQEPVGPVFGTAGEARTLLDAAIATAGDRGRLREGLPFSWYVDKTIDSLLQAARRTYEEEALAKKSVSTWRSIEKHWLPRAQWFDWLPNQVTTPDVQAFVNELVDSDNAEGEPLSPTFIRNVVALARKTFERAGISPNPARDLKLPAKGTPKVPHLELASQRQFFGSREEDISLEDRVMVGCGLGAGLRKGELLAMEITDVHLDDEDPHLWVRYGGPHRSPTKGRELRRVELYEPGLGFWRLYLERFYRPGSELVFAGPKGGFQKAWPEQFPGWAKHAGKKELTSHIMRHTFAVSLLSGTWGYAPKSLEFVSKQLGHAELQTTQRYYGAWEHGALQREVRRMTGRAEPATAGKVVTARVLLGLEADALADARTSLPQPKKAANDANGNKPRHPPQARPAGTAGGRYRWSPSLGYQNETRVH